MGRPHPVHRPYSPRSRRRSAASTPDSRSARMASRATPTVAWLSASERSSTSRPSSGAALRSCLNWSCKWLSTSCRSFLRSVAISSFDWDGPGAGPVCFTASAWPHRARRECAVVHTCCGVNPLRSLGDLTSAPRTTCLRGAFHRAGCSNNARMRRGLRVMSWWFRPTQPPPIPGEAETPMARLRRPRRHASDQPIGHCSSTWTSDSRTKWF